MFYCHVSHMINVNFSKNTCVEGSTYKIDPTEANEIIGKVMLIFLAIT